MNGIITMLFVLVMYVRFGDSNLSIVPHEKERFFVRLGAARTLRLCVKFTSVIRVTPSNSSKNLSLTLTSCPTSRILVR